MKNKYGRVFTKVAKSEGVSVKAMLSEVDKSIADAQSYNSDEAREFWGQFGEGKLDVNKVVEELTKEVIKGLSANKS